MSYIPLLIIVLILICIVQWMTTGTEYVNEKGKVKLTQKGIFSEFVAGMMAIAPIILIVLIASK